MNITGRDLEDKYERIMDSLNLYDSIWEDIDINLLLLAFIHPSGEKYIPESMRKKQYDKYLCNNYEWFEFVGDGILEIIVTTIVTEIQDVDILKNANIYKEELVKNITLYCYMIRRGLCKEIIMDPEKKYKYKMCADIFEALIGILYWWGYYIKGMGYSVLNNIREWMKKNWYLQESLDSLLNYNRVKCDIDEYGYREWSDWTSCDINDPSYLSYRTKQCIDTINCDDDIIEYRTCPTTRITLYDLIQKTNASSAKYPSPLSPQKRYLTSKYFTLDNYDKISIMMNTILTSINNQSISQEDKNALLKLYIKLNKYMINTTNINIDFVNNFDKQLRYIISKYYA